MAFMAENPPEVGELFFGRSGGDEPVVNYVARLDGISQYWQLSSPIILTDGYSVEVQTKGVTDDGGTRVVFTSGGTAYLPLNSSDKFAIYRRSNQTVGNVEIDGVDQGGAGEFPFDGAIHSLKFNVDRDIEISAIGYDENNAGRNITGAVYNFIVRDGSGNVVNEIPLTNKDQGATQLPTVGSISATMPNYTPDVWEVEE